MAYINIDKRGEQIIKQDDMLASQRFVIERKPDLILYHELEEAVVLDIVLDENHPELANSKLNAEEWPPNIDGSAPSKTDKNYSWLGRIKFRFLKSQVNSEKSSLDWAYPMENTGVVEYPLMNEVVVVGKYADQYFYTRKLNINSTVNSNAAFYAERISGRNDGNVNEYSPNGKYNGPKSKMNFYGGDNYEGILGSYFKFNPKIRTLRRFEGDTILESRFGSSIRFGAYDSTRRNDNGEGEYSDNGGNPMILIRNRQAPIQSPQGRTAKGYTIEDINKDGSSIHMTSGKTISGFVPQVGTQMINGKTAEKIPQLKGDQIIINSDRLVFSSKANEMLFFSKNRIGFATDKIFTVSSAQEMTFSTPKNVTINARQIFLGDHAKTGQPALLGRDTILWLEKLVDALNTSINSQLLTTKALIAHAAFHVPPLSVAPMAAIWKIQFFSLKSAQVSLEGLKFKLSSLLSSRVFVSPGD